jgi:DNA-binding Lrp family transcriptional regulator
MAVENAPRWRFLTNHAQVLVCIAHDPGVRLREISDRIGITERAAHRIVDELAIGGYITRERVGRRNRYTIQNGAPRPDRLGRVERVGDLLSVLADPNAERNGSAATTRPAAPRRRR